jgi:4-amino-4-deoxy-L-arabinose transferase-like glycosyltransferase
VWVLSGAIVFSFAQGMFHPFYVVTMAPPVAALVGAGVAALWVDHRGGGWRVALLPAAFLLTAAWEGYILGEYPDWRRLQLPWLVGGSLLAVGALFASRLARLDGNGARLWGRGALAVGLIALFISPTVWALTPLSNRGMGGVPAAGPDLFTRRQWRLGGASGNGEVDRLVGFLQAQRRGERFLLATATAMQASPIIIQTGEAVMAIGGWGGSDPILTVDQFTRLVVEGQVRYVLLPELDGGPWRGGRLTGSRNAELIRWVREHGKPVDPALWRSAAAPADGREDPAAPRGAAPGAARFAGSPTGGRRTGGPGRAAQLFDCRPEPTS